MRKNGGIMRTEAQRKADLRNKKKNSVRIYVRFYKSTDADLIEYCNSLDNVQGTVKEALREYKEAHK